MILETVAILSAAVGLIAIQPPLTRAFPGLLPKKVDPWVEFWSPAETEKRWPKPKVSSDPFDALRTIHLEQTKRAFEDSSALMASIKAEQILKKQQLEAEADLRQMEMLRLQEQERAARKLNDEWQIQSLPTKLVTIPRSTWVDEGGDYLGAVDYVAPRRAEQPPPQPTRVSSIGGGNKWDLQAQLKEGE